MAENKLSYLNRNFEDYRQGIIDITRQYYPDVFANLDDASVGAWLVDILSDIGDNLNFHIDRNVQETYLDSSREFSSIQNIARTNGLRIPYKKAALVEIELSCNLPLYQQGDESDGDMMADETYCPYVKRGTLFSNGTTTFELVNDIDFKEQFDENGYSNRQIIPNRNSNGSIVSYTYKKIAVASASRSRVMKKVITSEEVKPFMEVLINDTSILGIDSIIVKDGTNINTDPQFNEFFVDKETYKDGQDRDVERFFEVDNLIDQRIFLQNTDETTVGGKTYYNPVWSEEIVDVKDNNGNLLGSTVLRKVAKGRWNRIKNKFITEYTDDWKLKVIFGAGIRNQYGSIPDDAKLFTQYQMSRMLANDYMGVLPQSGKTMYILYRVGGGEISNIAADTLTNIISLNVEIQGNSKDALCAEKINNVRKSIRVTNTTPSYGGKDEPTMEEIRYMIRYNASSQNRCVTLKDYVSRISDIPAKYGCPFRHNAIEEINNIVIYTLGLDYDGHLANYLSETVANNIKLYISQYRMLNDFIEIKSGKIINLSFKLTVYVDKSYDKSEVTKRIIDTVYDYMDIRRHLMGDDIFVGDLEKEISKLDGVINLVKMRIFNRIGNGYSEDRTTQQLVDLSKCEYEETDDEDTPYSDDTKKEIDLSKSDYMLYNEADSMFEIKNKNADIEVVVKTRN